jgi:hypothetical protein
MNHLIVKVGVAILAGIGLISCAALKETARYEFVDDEYWYKQRPNKYQKVYIDAEMENGVIDIYPIDPALKDELPTVKENADQYFVMRDLHLNILTIPFKFRPSVAGFPSQLNSNFNGELFLGYRIDKFRRHFKNTPAGIKDELLHWGVSGGMFGGIGSSVIAPWTTSYQTMDEYNGFVLSRGVGILGSINRLNVGFAIGWDYLTDRDKNIWIHQNKIWYGLALGLNLN